MSDPKSQHSTLIEWTSSLSLSPSFYWWFVCVLRLRVVVLLLFRTSCSAGTGCRLDLSQEGVELVCCTCQRKNLIITGLNSICLESQSAPVWHYWGNNTTTLTSLWVAGMRHALKSAFLKWAFESCAEKYYSNERNQQHLSPAFNYRSAGLCACVCMQKHRRLCVLLCGCLHMHKWVCVCVPMCLVSD